MICPNCATENVELIQKAEVDEEPDHYKCCECGYQFTGEYSTEGGMLDAGELRKSFGRDLP